MMWTQADSDIRQVRSQLGVKEFPADERVLTLAEEACREANPDISTFKGRVASGDQFIDSKEKKTGSMTHLTRTAQRWKAQQLLRPHT